MPKSSTLLSYRSQFKKYLTAIITLIFVLIFVILAVFSIRITLQKPDELLINDVSRLNPTHVRKIEKNSQITGLQEVLKEARQNNLKVSIAGKRHSMGGHTFYKDAVVLDMTSFNKILSINPQEKTMRVQSGATWDKVIEALNPFDLSVPVLQDYSGFTVGGSLSVNVHHSNPKFGSISEIVKSFRLLLADGSIINVSRTENPELFRLVLGGYGLFGVILDTDLQLIKNNSYEKKEYIMSYKQYTDFFSDLRKQEAVEEVFARLSIVKDSSFLDEIIITTYSVTDSADESFKKLKPNKNMAIKKFLFGLSRSNNFGKKVRWYFQKNYSNLSEPALTTRNNLDYNDLRFLDYKSNKDTDILQEYFFPRDKLSEFIDKLRILVKETNINLLNATIRYVPYNNESFLSYSNRAKEMFAVVLYINVGLSSKEQKRVETWTQKLIDYSINIGGTYYLPYQLYASQEQIRKAYPTIDEFFEMKKKYDPQELFFNNFYAKYAKKEKS